jgi:hypothetical protein
MLQMEYEPQGVVENLGGWLGVVSRRVANDLARIIRKKAQTSCKSLIE